VTIPYTFVQQITLLAKQVLHKQVKPYPYDVLHFENSDSPLMQKNG
jgi:hypothetical protein